MARLQLLLECIGRAVCDSGTEVLTNESLMTDRLYPIAGAMHQMLARRLPRDRWRECLREAVTVPPRTLELTVDDALLGIGTKLNELERERLRSYLDQIPSCIRQFLRRPGDVDGLGVPEQLPVDQPEDWLLFLPDRVSQFREEEAPDWLEGSKLESFRGHGNGSEVWIGSNPKQLDQTKAALKFITHPKLKQALIDYETQLLRVLDLEPIAGIIPLRSVTMLSNPPCLEFLYLPSYDLTGVMRDWKWRYKEGKPDQAQLIIKRVAKVLGRQHRLKDPMIHRGLKPSNILVHPAKDGKATIWIADWGYAEMAAKVLPPAMSLTTVLRQKQRGSYAPLYQSPQQREDEASDPRDDIYALGVIWYQLLKRDPAAIPNLGSDWAAELFELGLSNGPAELLTSCLAHQLQQRPVDGQDLVERMDTLIRHPVAAATRTFQLNGTVTQTNPTMPKMEDGTDEDEPMDTPILLRRFSTPPPQPTRFSNSIGMPLVLVKSGLGMTLPVKPFYVGAHPVTQGQFFQVMRRKPSAAHRSDPDWADYPVENLSWREAIDFCQKLSQMPTEKNSNRKYRLLTEEEWEIACLAGIKSPFAFGEDLRLVQDRVACSENVPVFSDGTIQHSSTRVGSFMPNAWGLFDMHGNVMEWCEDRFQSETFLEIAVDRRVVKGGSFRHSIRDCSAKWRDGVSVDSRMPNLGFRVALTLTIVS
jgi:serine/threonine protein kinase